MKINKLNLPEEWPEFNNVKILDEDIKKEPGVYLLFNENLELLYIGQTASFRNRLLGHVSPKHQRRMMVGEWKDYVVPRGLVKYYSFLKLEERIDRLCYEMFLIKLLKPILNYPKTSSKPTENGESLRVEEGECD